MNTRAIHLQATESQAANDTGPIPFHIDIKPIKNKEITILFLESTGHLINYNGCVNKSIKRGKNHEIIQSAHLVARDILAAVNYDHRLRIRYRTDEGNNCCVR